MTETGNKKLFDELLENYGKSCDDLVLASRKIIKLKNQNKELKKIITNLEDCIRYVVKKRKK